MPNQNYRRRYRNSGDVSQRHSGTYVGLVNSDGVVVPHRVIETAGSVSSPMAILEGRDGRRQEVSFISQDLILDRTDCGFANFLVDDKECCVYFSTRALRQYKRSLNFSHLSRNYICGFARRSLELSRNNILFAVGQFYNDNYPKLEVALHDLRIGVATSIAFSRKFALTIRRGKGIVLFYKNQAVGYVREDNEPILLPAYQYLEEQLEESKC